MALDNNITMKFYNYMSDIEITVMCRRCVQVKIQLYSQLLVLNFANSQQTKINNDQVFETRLFIKKKENWNIQIQREIWERGEFLPQSIKKTKNRNKEVSDKLATLAQEDKSSQVALQNNQISKPLSS